MMILIKSLFTLMLLSIAATFFFPWCVFIEWGSVIGFLLILIWIQ